MEWGDVHDPKGEFEITVNWEDVMKNYLPEEIQDMINRNGVQGMVRKVNDLRPALWSAAPAS